MPSELLRIVEGNFKYDRNLRDVDDVLTEIGKNFRLCE